MYFDMEDDEKMCHVMWLEHSSRTLQGSFGDQRELFAYSECCSEDLSAVCGKVNVLIVGSNQEVPDHFSESYFVRYSLRTYIF
jgi:hypothetical protein